MVRLFVIPGTVLSLSVAPAMAKPDTITVILKTSGDNKPIKNWLVEIHYTTDGVTWDNLLVSGMTDLRGKAVLSFDPPAGMQSTVKIYLGGLTGPQGTVVLTAQNSARVTLYLF